MDFFLILPYYFAWHYGRAYADIKGILKNFLLFFYHFFSIPDLLRTLFSPWQRIHDEYGKGSFLETAIFNTIMRFLGIFIRLFFILLGLAAIVCTAVFGVLFFFVWLLVPFILLCVFLWGLKELII